MVRLFILLMATTPLWAEPCNRPVDPNKVILYVDMNASIKEIAAAQRAACAKGQSFLSVPNIDPRALQSDESEKRIMALENKWNGTGCGDQQVKSASCTGWAVEMNQHRARINKLASQIPQFEAKELDQVVKRLASANKAITSVIFSGHDGGGFVGGHNGNVNKTDFMSSMKRHYAGKPQLYHQLKSALLWGCYSDTAEEVLEWKAAFPNLKVIGGFGLMGPSNIQPSSLAMLEDLLKSVDDIAAKQGTAAVKNAINHVKGLTNLNSTVWVNACDNEYYYNLGLAGVNSFGIFKNMLSCDKIPKVEETLANIRLYYSGVKEPSKPALRPTYNVARTYDHCFPPNHIMEGDRVALLMFFNSVKFNFGRTFKDLNSKTSAEWNSLGSFISQQINRETNKLSVLKDPKKLAALNSLGKALLEARKSIFLPDTRLTNRNRREILKNISTFESIVTHPAVQRYPEVRSRLKNFILLHQKMQRYLYQVDPRCMNFLEWHEQIEGKIARPRC